MKDKNHSDLIVGFVSFLIIFLICIFAVAMKFQEIDKQLSNKADRVCYNETSLVDKVDYYYHPVDCILDCNESINYNLYNRYEIVTTIAETKEVCEIK